MDEQYREVLEKAAKYSEDLEHACQDSHISNALFSRLQKLIPKEYARPDLLTYAAILHDIGWVGGQVDHNKRSLEMIVSDPPKGLSEREILIVANIARYHRKAVPKTKHDSYAGLPEKDKQIVRYMSALLRIADGLDAGHDSAAEVTGAEISDDSITISITAGAYADMEIEEALGKSDLFEQVFNRKLKFRHAEKPEDKT